MESAFETINKVNRRELDEFREFTESSGTGARLDSERFGRFVINIQATILHSYKLAAECALNEENPLEAASVWKGYIALCDEALSILRRIKERSAATSLEDLILDYRKAALDRQQQNLQAAECLGAKIPDHWFPKPS